MQHLKILLDEFEQIPKIKSSNPTLIEIAGFPHYENVCSNILAYYFETQNPHGLSNLLLKSLVDCLSDIELYEIFETVDVRREEPTANRKRLDIIIETEDLVIGIENKIYAALYNDLDNYSAHLNKVYASKKNILKVVLSLSSTFSGVHPSGFVNITYHTFIQSIKKNIGSYVINGDSKAIIFLLDFMNTIENLTKPETMNTETLEFFNNNQEAINNLLEERNKLQQYIANKVNQLKGLISPQPSSVTQWIYKKHDLVHDFYFDEVVIAVDCVFDFGGIQIMVWVRRGNVDRFEYLKNLNLYLHAPFSEVDFQNNRIIIVEKEDMPLLTPLDVIANKLNEILSNIILIDKTKG